MHNFHYSDGSGDDGSATMMTNNQLGYVPMHGISYYLYTAVPFTAIVFGIVVPIWCLLKRTQRRLYLKMHVTHGQNSVDEHVNNGSGDLLAIMKEIKVHSKDFKSSRYSWLLDDVLRMENMWFMLAFVIMQGLVIFILSMHSVQFQFRGLMMGMLGGVIFSLLAVIHLFRSRGPERQPMSHKGKTVHGRNIQENGEPSPLSPTMLYSKSIRNRSMANLEAIQYEDVPDDSVIIIKHSARKRGSRFDTAAQMGYFGSVIHGIRRRRGLFVLTLLLSIPATILAYLLPFGLCVCVQPFELTSSLLRSLTQPICSPGEICFTYLNLAEDPSSQMIVKFHTYDSPAPGSSHAAHLLLGSSPALLNRKVSCHSVDNSPNTLDLFNNGKKFVHTCDITHLQPDTEYYFRPVLETSMDDKRSEIVTITLPSKVPPLKFRTLHNDPSRSVKFVNGGDLGATSEAFHMLDVAIEQDPDFIALGGDISYANGFTTCYRRWVYILRHYSERAVSKSGTMIPLLTSIGNHEAEWNQFSMMPWNANSYLHLFTHKVGIQHRIGTVVKSNQGVFHAHNLAGHTLLLVLDSGVVMPHAAQNEFIKEQLTNTDAVNRIAMYHAPLYPSSRSFNGPPSVRGREMWEPLFNEYGVQVALEHHDHAFKRTKRILRGKVISSSDTDAGTVYLGDGLMGVGGRSVDTSREYLERAESTRHIWLIECNPTGATFSAIDEDGNTFDKFAI